MERIKIMAQGRQAGGKFGPKVDAKVNGERAEADLTGVDGGDVDQESLFPELEPDTKPEHKELIKRSRKYAKEKLKRDELLSTNKAEVQALHDKVAEQLHVCGIKKFKHGDLVVELTETSEKVKVKFESDDGSDDDD